MEPNDQTAAQDRRILSYLTAGWSYEQVLITERQLTYLDIFGAADRLVARFSEPSPKPSQDLFEMLRRWRLSKAHELDVPPFTIFWDEHLRDIVRLRPATLEELRRCRGVGPARLEAHGGEILSIIESATRPSPNRDLPPGSRSVLEMLATGHTYRQIIAEYPHMTFRGIFSAIDDAVRASTSLQQAS